MYRLFAALLLILVAPVVVTQDDDILSPDAVRALYESHGVPFSGVDQGRPALLIFSAGCAQCVELSTLHKDELIELLTERGFHTRFVEMPGAVAEPEEQSAESEELLRSARVSANSASMILECSSGSSGEDAISLIADLGRAGRLLTGTQPDPDQLLTTDWANWPYLSSLDDSGQSQSMAAGVLQMVVGARNIDLSTCDQDAVWDTLGDRHAAILNTGISYVPGLYLLPDESFPRFMVWDYEDLKELVLN